MKGETYLWLAHSVVLAELLHLNLMMITNWMKSVCKKYDKVQMGGSRLKRKVMVKRNRS
jgi:hypothetical protein